MQGNFKFFDWPLFSSIAILSLIGLVMIYSTGLSESGSSGTWIKQLIAIGLGLAGMIFFSQLDYRFLKKSSGIFFILSIIFLVVLLVFGREIRGSVRWFELGPVNFQPSELAKFALLILLAKFFEVKGFMLQRFRYVALSFVYVVILVALIMQQPDLGTSLTLFAIWFGMLLMSPLSKKYFLYLFLIFAGLAAAGWRFFLADFQKDRIMTFFNPFADPLGRGYNVIQSIVAVGAGGWSGRGLARGLQSQLRFLPERQTDFIFASTVEELGLIGGILILGLLLFALVRMIFIIRKARDPFGVYLATGIFFLFFTQIAINIGMNLGLLPVTGITLPFLSYGGSSLIVSFWLIGILQSIAARSVPVKFG